MAIMHLPSGSICACVFKVSIGLLLLGLSCIHHFLAWQAMDDGDVYIKSQLSICVLVYYRPVHTQTMHGSGKMWVERLRDSGRIQALEKFLRMKDLILPLHRYTIIRFITARVLCITLTRPRIDMGCLARCHPKLPGSQWTFSGQTQEFYTVAGVLIN
jgi:hypothetical protein